LAATIRQDLKPIRRTDVPFRDVSPDRCKNPNVIGKGGTRDSSAKSFDPYTLYPTGDTLSMDKIGTDSHPTI